MLLWCVQLCGYPWSVCEVVLVTCAVTDVCAVIVWGVSMLRECEGDSNAGVGDEGCVVAVSCVLYLVHMTC